MIFATNQSKLIYEDMFVVRCPLDKNQRIKSMKEENQKNN